MSQVSVTKWLICRICLNGQSKKLYNIFEPISEEEITDLGTTLLEKIELCGAIELNQQHNLPNKICCRCVLLLRAAYKFRDLCQQSQKQLNEFITTLPPQNENVDRTLDINFDSDAEEQKVQVQEDDRLLPNENYVVEESVVEYDNLSYEHEQNSVPKNDYMDVIDDDIVEIQSFSDDESSKYIVEEVGTKEFVYEGDDDESRNYTYVEDGNSDNIIIEEQHKKPKSKFFVKRINEKKPLLNRKGRTGKDEGFSKVYNCTYCDNTYTDKTKFTNHMKIHVNKKPHECEICKKRFSTTPQLSRHMNSHTGNRPYKCQYCDASFGDPSTKIKHERIHTNERPYKCAMCDKAFAYSNVLKVHMMTHTGEKPHICEYCGKAFSQLHHKNAHEKRHTNIDMVILPNSPEVDYIKEDSLKELVEEII